MYEKDVRIIHGVHNPVKLIFGHVPDTLSINDRFRTVAGEVAPVLIAGIPGIRRSAQFIRIRMI